MICLEIGMSFLFLPISKKKREKTINKAVKASHITTFQRNH